MKTTEENPLLRTPLKNYWMYRSSIRSVGDDQSTRRKCNAYCKTNAQERELQKALQTLSQYRQSANIISEIILMETIIARRSNAAACTYSGTH